MEAQDTSVQEPAQAGKLVAGSAVREMIAQSALPPGAKLSDHPAGEKDPVAVAQPFHSRTVKHTPVIPHMPESTPPLGPDEEYPPAASDDGDGDEMFEDERVRPALPAARPPQVPAPSAPVSEPDVKWNPGKLEAYLSRKQRIQLDLRGGTLLMKVIDVLVSDLTVALVLPAETDDCVFLPAVGESLSVRCAAGAFPCVSHGLVQTIDPLGITIVTLVKRGEDKAQEH